MVVKRMIDKTDAKLTLFNNGQETLDFIKAGNQADFILMDIQMP